MNFKILFILFSFSFSSCYTCVDEQIAVVIKVESVMTVSGKTASRGSRELVFIKYNVKGTDYNKSFWANGIHYRKGNRIKIKTAKNPNNFCLED